MTSPAETTPRTAKGRAGAVREEAFTENGIISIGIDPGSRYTALVVRNGDVVIHATTVTRVGDQEPIPYARLVIDALAPIVAEFIENFPDAVIGIEGVTDPKGFKHGKRAALNPKDIMRTGVTAGALAAVFPTAHIVRPGNNGSMHLSQYPSNLRGRRPTDLPGSSNGAGTRSHEQSAYDIAGKVLTIAREEATK